MDRSKVLVSARSSAGMAVLRLQEAIDQSNRWPVPEVPDDAEANDLRGLEDSLVDALARVRRARTDMEIALGLEEPTATAA